VDCVGLLKVDAIGILMIDKDLANIAVQALGPGGAAGKFDRAVGQCAADRVVRIRKIDRAAEELGDGQIGVEICPVDGTRRGVIERARCLSTEFPDFNFAICSQRLKLFQHAFGFRFGLDGAFAQVC
jgi:hypothetical protein